MEISTFSFSNNGNVTYGVQNNSRGYFNIKLHRARRMLGHEFGGEQMSRNIAVFMARHPPPVPPIEVSVYLRLFRSFPDEYLFFWFNEMLIADQYSHFCCAGARRSK